MFNHMVEHPRPLLDTTFSALADPTRRSLLARLAEGEATVTQLAQPFDTSLAAISKHLQVLERAGLVRRRIEGRSHYLSLDSSPLLEALSWLVAYRQFWDASLSELADLLGREA